VCVLSTSCWTQSCPILSREKTIGKDAREMKSTDVEMEGGQKARRVAGGERKDQEGNKHRRSRERRRKDGREKTGGKKRTEKTGGNDARKRDGRARTRNTRGRRLQVVTTRKASKPPVTSAISRANACKKRIWRAHVCEHAPHGIAFKTLNLARATLDSLCRILAHFFHRLDHAVTLQVVLSPVEEGQRGR